VRHLKDAYRASLDAPDPEKIELNQVKTASATISGVLTEVGKRVHAFTNAHPQTVTSTEVKT
jgi:hypothetical protein